MVKIKSQASTTAKKPFTPELNTPVITQKQAEVLQQALELGYKIEEGTYEVATISGIQYNKAYGVDRRNAGKAWVDELRAFIKTEAERLREADDWAPEDGAEPDSQDAEQEIIEVSKERVKEALRTLLSRKNKFIAMLYEKHAEYNETFFEGALSTPVITIDKMDNRTLGNYTYEGDPMAVDQHIKFNQNFVALNEDGRIFETLRHEMIHQWQDEVAYAKRGAKDEELKMTKIPKIDPESKAIVFESELQRRRPKETHNNEFRLYAAIVNIPANGPNCTGNPANMPEPQSYNHKFACGCRATNKYPITIYSTRLDVLDMFVCQKCISEGRSGKLVLMDKQRPNAKTIEVKLSHVEKPGQDAIMDEMTGKFGEFVRFPKKSLKDKFVAELSDRDVPEEHPLVLEQGVYQKGHNAYAWGHRYWVAYTMPDVPKSASRSSKKKPLAPPTAPQAETPPLVETPSTKAVITQQEPPATQEVESGRKSRVAAGKAAKKDNVVQFPAAQPVPTAVPPAPVPVDEFDPQAVIDAYAKAGSIRKAGELLGIPYTSLTRKITKYSIDFNAGTFKLPE
jgi:predicted SprT family Zn-dependent metalloprotease